MNVTDKNDKACYRHKITPRGEQEKKLLIGRINKIGGQISGVKKMIEEDRYCEDVLIQLSAIDKAVKSLVAQILEQHLHSCLITKIKEGDDSSLDEIVTLFKKFS